MFRPSLKTSFVQCGSLSLFLLLEACCASRPQPPCLQGAHRASEPPRSSQAKPRVELLKVRGGAHLDGLHPQLIKRARLLYERAEGEGIKLRFISGYRRYRPRRKARAGRSVASWHNFGAAFDLILHEHKSMRVALENLEADQARWDRVGSLAKELGLVWGKAWGVKEIFHFEWHPGHPEALRAPAFKRLTQVTGPKVIDYQRAWKLFKAE